MRPPRLLRLVVLIGVLQKAIGNAVRGRILVFTISGVVLLIYVASLAIFKEERDQPGAKIVSFGTAMCAGHQHRDHHRRRRPVSDNQYRASDRRHAHDRRRFITLIGVVTASLASWIVQRVSETDRALQTATAAHIDELRDEIRMLAEELRRSR